MDTAVQKHRENNIMMENHMYTTKAGNPIKYLPTKKCQAVYEEGYNTCEAFVTRMMELGSKQPTAVGYWNDIIKFYDTEGDIAVHKNERFNSTSSAPRAVSSSSAQVFTPVVDTRTDEEILFNIRKRFGVMEKMTYGVIAGTIRSLIISGAPGTSKTYTTEKLLSEAADAGHINYEMLKIKVSAFGLYIKLFEMKEKGDILVLDDVDVFGNEDTLNVLKAALDTGSKRILTWGTTSSYLQENDIPNSFEYEGTVVFITNTDMDKEIQRGTKISPHLDALQSRSIYLSLGVHTNREIMLRVQDVVQSTTMLQDRGINDEEAEAALAWMVDNVDKLRSVSLRTALYVADFIRTDRDEWRDVCDVTLLK